MKNMRKLIPAMCLLLISAMMLGTSTFAWFSMNTSVQATNLQVKAKSSGSLYINMDLARPTYTDVILDTVDFDGTAVELMPVSSTNLSAWYAGTAERADNYEKASAGTFSDVSSVATTQYVLKKTVWIRSESNFDKLQVNKTTMTATAGTGGNNGLGGALTMAFKVVDYAKPDAAATVVDIDNGNCKTFVANEATTRRHGTIASAALDTSTITFVNVDDAETTAIDIWTKTGAVDVANCVFQVEIYFFFDGQSESCYSNALTNAISLNGTASVSFTTAQNPTT